MIVQPIEIVRHGRPDGAGVLLFVSGESKQETVALTSRVWFDSILVTNLKRKPFLLHSTALGVMLLFFVVVHHTSYIIFVHIHYNTEPNMAVLCCLQQSQQEVPWSCQPAEAQGLHISSGTG